MRGQNHGWICSSINLLTVAAYIPVAIIVLFFGCAKKSEIPLVPALVQVDFGSLAINASAGGIAVVDVFGGAETTYAFASSSAGVVLDLPVGTHTFHAFAWGGPNPLEGIVYCGSSTANLEDSTVTGVQDVAISVAVANCTNYTTSGDDTTYGFDPIAINSCLTAGGISAFGDNCDTSPLAWGETNSFKFSIAGTNGVTLQSGCLKDDGSGNDTTKGDKRVDSQVRIPTGGPLGIVPDIVLTGYDRLDCTEYQYADTLDLSGGFESGLTDVALFGDGSTLRLFWGQNAFNSESDIMSSYIPNPNCGASAPFDNCVADYDLTVSLNSSDYDLYYSTASLPAGAAYFYSNDANPNFDFDGGVAVPTACSVTSYSGYSGTAPDCSTCSSTAGDNGNTTAGCTLAIPSHGASDYFTGHPQSTPKSITMNLTDGTNSTSVTQSLFLSYDSFSVAKQVVEPIITLLGSDYGLDNYWHHDGDLAYPYRNDGELNNAFKDLGVDGISGMMDYLGYTSCADTLGGGSLTGTYGGDTATFTLTENTSPGTNFPVNGFGSTLLNYNRQYQLSISGGGHGEVIGWLMECNSGTPLKKGEFYLKEYDTGSHLSVSHGAFDFTLGAPVFQLIQVDEEIGTSKSYRFFHFVRNGNDGWELAYLSIGDGGGNFYGQKSYATKASASSTLKISASSSQTPAAVYADASTDFGAVIGGGILNQDDIDMNSYSATTYTGSAPANIQSILYTIADPAATPWVNPAYVADLVKNSTCSGAGSARSVMECHIYSRSGLTPSLTGLLDSKTSQFWPIPGNIFKTKSSRSRDSLKELRDKFKKALRKKNKGRESLKKK